MASSLVGPNFSPHVVTLPLGQRTEEKKGDDDGDNGNKVKLSRCCGCCCSNKVETPESLMRVYIMPHIVKRAAAWCRWCWALAS